mgnify:CR=1 FL=1
MKKKGQMNIVGTVIGAIAGLVSLVVIVVVSGLINTVSADVVAEYQTGTVTDNPGANCGKNSTGGTGGTIAYTNCPQSYDIAAATLTNQQSIADRTDSFTNTGLGMLIIGVIIAFAGGFIGSRF